ncbi:MAG: hypothetical protein KDA20_08115 [Phycisphaerales bacterium]|nr:hypothetical protein [Phycisphaerales bacterium]
MALAACANANRSSSDLRHEGQKLFGPDAAGPGLGAAAGQGWGVVLENFTGPHHAAQATLRKDELEAALERGDLSVRTTTSGSAILLGSHANADDPGAQRDLAWARNLDVGGNRPYQRAFLAPPAAGDRGSRPEFNLANAKATYGKSAIYTLQIAVWDMPDRAKARAEAERQAIELRQEGFEAFYYHGAQRSMVTVGVFTASDYNLVSGEIDVAVRAAQERFPNNLLNGEPYRAAGERRLVGSALVRIPD